LRAGTHGGERGGHLGVEVAARLGDVHHLPAAIAKRLQVGALMLIALAGDQLGG
jgi:hypothetical protein